MNPNQKLQRLPEYLLTAVTLVFGIGFTLYAGRLVGEGKISLLVASFSILAVIALSIKLREKVWLFIPMCWGLIGQISILPLPFAVRDLAVLYVFASFLLFKALKLVRIKPPYTYVDALMSLNVAYVVTVFLRNPVGVAAISSERVGGKPYLGVVIAYLAYWVLSRVVITPRQGRVMPLLVVASSGLIAFLSILTRTFPSVVPVLAPLYSGLDPGAYLAQDVKFGETDMRFEGLMFFGKDAITALCSFFRPVTILVPVLFGRFTGFILAAAAILASGFRSIVIYAVGIFFLSSFLRRSSRELIVPIIVGGFLLAFILFGQGTAFSLPYPVQRALSFLPGNWDYDAVLSGSGSTEWRTEMWKIALTSDRFIHDKVLGDGFGFTRLQLEQMDALSGGVRSDEQTREIAMIAGDFHSGPLSAIRFVGVVGLIFFYAFIIFLALAAYRLIRRAKGGPYYIPALFVGLPILMEPFFYTFIFGGYQNALPTAIFSLGMIKMIEQSMAVSASIPETSPALVAPIPRRQRPLPAFTRAPR